MTLLNTIKKHRERIYDDVHKPHIVKYHYKADGIKDWIYVNHAINETEKQILQRIKKRHDGNFEFEFIKVEVTEVSSKDGKKWM